MYLLDTNPCIEILRNSQPPTKNHLEQHDPSEIYLCSVVVAELFYGARKAIKLLRTLPWSGSFAHHLLACLLMTIVLTTMEQSDAIWKGAA